MDKRSLIVVSILAVVLLVLGSLSNVVGYQTITTSNKNLLKGRVNQKQWIQNNYHFYKITDIAPVFYTFLFLIMIFVLIVSIPVFIPVFVFSGLTVLFFVKILDKCEDLGMNFNNSIFYRFIYTLSLIPGALLLISGTYISFIIIFIAGILLFIFGGYPLLFLTKINRMHNIYRRTSMKQMRRGENH